MSIAVTIKVDADLAAVQRLRTGLSKAGMKALHARIATDAAAYIAEYVANDVAPRSHRSAEMLGAAPTSHLETSAKRIQAEGAEEAAVIGIPRKSRLRAAFGGFEIRPTGGKTYLTIPAHPLTYGKMPSGPGAGAFRFATIHTHRGPTPALVFAGGVNKGKVAYWLRRSVQVKEARHLLPWDQLPKVAARVASQHLAEIANAVGGAA